MREMRWIMLVGMLCILAACSGNPSNGTGGQVTVRDTPATAAPAEAPGMGEPPGTMETPGTMQNPTAGQAPAADPQLGAATTAGQQWLGLVDQGQYAESWSATGQLFQRDLPQDRWVQTLTSARTPHGTVVSRDLAGREIRTNLPGVPTGQYAVVSFATNFQNKPDIIETVTLVLEPDGQWRVVGYNATPRSVLLEQQQPGQGQPTPQPTPPPATTPTPTPTPMPTPTPPQA